MAVKWLSDGELCTNRVNMFAIVYLCFCILNEAFLPNLK